MRHCKYRKHCNTVLPPSVKGKVDTGLTAEGLIYMQQLTTESVQWNRGKFLMDSDHDVAKTRQFQAEPAAGWSFYSDSFEMDFFHVRTKPKPSVYFSRPK